MRAEKKTGSPRVSALTLAADLTCFVLFGLLGLQSHAESLNLANFARAVLPFAVAWPVTAAAFGVLRLKPANGPFARRLLAAWLPAWAAGLAARTLVFGRPFVPAFAFVSFLVPAFLLLAWRAALLNVEERRSI